MNASRKLNTKTVNINYQHFRRLKKIISHQNYVQLTLNCLLYQLVNILYEPRFNQQLITNSCYHFPGIFYSINIVQAVPFLFQLIKLVRGSYDNRLHLFHAIIIWQEHEIVSNQWRMSHHHHSAHLYSDDTSGRLSFSFYPETLKKRGVLVLCFKQNFYKYFQKKSTKRINQ